MNDIEKAIDYLYIQMESGNIQSDRQQEVYELAIKALDKQLNNGWIPVSERLPEEYVCDDGEYDPSEFVLIQLDNGIIETSRYWAHRRCKDVIIKQPWLDISHYKSVIAWQPLPLPYKEDNNE